MSKKPWYMFPIEKPARSIDFLCIGLGYLILIIFFIVSWIDNNGTWFARSGSIAVLLGAFVQFRIGEVLSIAMEDSINLSAVVGVGCGINLPKHTKTLAFTTLCLICASTLIWGYGDLLFPLLTNLIKY